MADYDTIEVVPVTGALGAEIRGADLRRPLTDAQRDDVHEALMRHLVVFFRDQPLSEDEQLQFASTFGAPYLSTTNPDDPGSVFTTLEDTPESPPKADRWHTDVSFSDAPPDFAVLHMLTAPPVGGDTMWVSLYGAYEALSAPMQRAISDLEVDHDLGATAELLRQLNGEEYYQRMIKSFRPPRHPLVRVHPDTGRRALYLAGSFMRGIAGMHLDESELMLRFLKSRLDDPNIQCRWQWRQHDVAMWDERCTDHRALSDHFPHYRKVRRCLAGSGVPTGPEGRAALSDSAI